ncbi:MAG: transcriptional regulator PpsR [Betaproteobacteria bacterium]
MTQFIAPKKSLGNLDVDAAAKLIAASADVALVLDQQGVIRDVAVSNPDLGQEGYADWLGQSWAEIVTPESRPKIEALLRDAGGDKGSTWRHVNHPSARGSDVPMLYSAIKVGKTGKVVAVGRNLRQVAQLQQRLVEAQQSLERDYARLRHAETRYRMLFQLASEAIIVIDAGNEKVIELNPAAQSLLGASAKQLAGKPFPEVFDALGGRAVTTLLNRVRNSGYADDIKLRLRAGGPTLSLSVSLFQQDRDAQFIARLALLGAAGNAAAVSPSAAMRAIENSPDGFVVTDADGRLLSANRAFLDVVQCPSEDRVRGKSIAQWLGRPGADLSVLLANLRQHGTVRLFATTLRGELGLSTEVEISAVQVPDPTETVLGFVIRSVGRRLPATASAGERELPRSPEQLTELIGRVPLKDIVRETTDVIERLCIEAALELTGDNRASAAEMLGLSRQSLYLKLHRYGLGELDGGE